MKDTRVRQEYSVNEDLYILTIRDTKSEDGGLYMVEAENEGGKTSQSVSVNVTEKMLSVKDEQDTVLLLAPTPTMKLEPVTADVGGIVCLKCKFEGQISVYFCFFLCYSLIVKSLIYIRERALHSFNVSTY